jgi:hypothetical protein
MCRAQATGSVSRTMLAAMKITRSCRSWWHVKVRDRLAFPQLTPCYRLLNAGRCHLTTWRAEVTPKAGPACGDVSPLPEIVLSTPLAVIRRSKARLRGASGQFEAPPLATWAPYQFHLRFYCPVWITSSSYGERLQVPLQWARTMRRIRSHGS